MRLLDRLAGETPRRAWHVWEYDGAFYVVGPTGTVTNRCESRERADALVTILNQRREAQRAYNEQRASA